MHTVGLSTRGYSPCVLLFFFNDTATTEIYTLSLHDALPISRDREPVLRRADDRALDHVRMADEAVLDLGRGDPDPADLDQVVHAAAVPEEPVVVALEEIARVHGVAVEGARRLLLVAPVVERRGVARDEKLAGLAELGFVARDELAGRSGTCSAGPVRDVDVVQLGRDDPGQHLHH